MKKIDYKYEDVKRFIESNYLRDKDKIDEIGIIEYNDYFVDNVLGNKIFENEIDEFIYTLSICLIMNSMKLNDDYFFNTLKELTDNFLNGNYDEYFLDIKDKNIIKKDIALISDLL